MQVNFESFKIVRTEDRLILDISTLKVSDLHQHCTLVSFYWRIGRYRVQSRVQYSVQDWVHSGKELESLRFSFIILHELHTFDFHSHKFDTIHPVFGFGSLCAGRHTIWVLEPVVFLSIFYFRVSNAGSGIKSEDPSCMDQGIPIFRDLPQKMNNNKNKNLFADVD